MSQLHRSLCVTLHTGYITQIIPEQTEAFSQGGLTPVLRSHIVYEADGLVSLHNKQNH